MTTNSAYRNRKTSRVPFIGLTGGLGAGKSTALAELAALGAAVISSDAVVHELYSQASVEAAVVERFGREVCHAGGIDRRALARIVFKDESARTWLEQFLWPKVAARTAEFRAEASRRTPAPLAVVVESPLLFEAGMGPSYDATVAVIADPDVRRRRLMLRDHESLEERERRQMSQDEKARLATFVVANNGTTEELSAQLRAVLASVSRGSRHDSAGVSTGRSAPT